MGGIHKELPEGLDEVDVVIAGGSWFHTDCCTKLRPFNMP